MLAKILDQLSTDRVSNEDPPYQLRFIIQAIRVRARRHHNEGISNLCDDNLKTFFVVFVTRNVIIVCALVRPGALIVLWLVTLIFAGTKRQGRRHGRRGKRRGR
jgi:hypothetical protein